MSRDSRDVALRRCEPSALAADSANDPGVPGRCRT